MLIKSHVCDIILANILLNNIVKDPEFRKLRKRSHKKMKTEKKRKKKRILKRGTDKFRG